MWAAWIATRQKRCRNGSLMDNMCNNVSWELNRVGWPSHLFAVGDLGHTMFYLVDSFIHCRILTFGIATILHLTDHTTCNIDEDIRIRATKSCFRLCDQSFLSLCVSSIVDVSFHLDHLYISKLCPFFWNTNWPPVYLIHYICIILWVFSDLHHCTWAVYANTMSLMRGVLRGTTLQI